MQPATTYALHVSASLGGEAAQREDAGTWSFTTEAAPSILALEFPVNLRDAPVRWHGQFFSGLCNVIFCTQAANYGPTYDLMADARKQHPRAWSYQRDFWPTGTEYRPSGFLAQMLPNIVRERETRRIAAIEAREASVVLRVEDVFGHQQYGSQPVDPWPRSFPEAILQVTPGVAAGHGQLMSRQRAPRRSTVPDPAGGGRRHASGD